MFNVYVLLQWLAFFRPTFLLSHFRIILVCFPFAYQHRRCGGGGCCCHRKFEHFCLAPKFLLLRKRNWLSLKMSHREWRKYLSFDLENRCAQLSILAACDFLVPRNLLPSPNNLHHHPNILYCRKTRDEICGNFIQRNSVRIENSDYSLPRLAPFRGIFFVLSSFYIVDIIAGI